MKLIGNFLLNRLKTIYLEKKVNNQVVMHLVVTLAIHVRVLTVLF